MKAYQVKRNSKRQNYDTDTPHPLLPLTVIKETHCGLRLLCNTAGHQRKQSVPHTDLSQGYSPWIELLPLDLQTCLSQSYSPWIELFLFDLKLYHPARVILLGQSYFSLIIKLSWPELPFLERVTVFRSFLSFFFLRFGSPQLIDWFSTLPIRVVQQCIMGMLLVPDGDQSHCRV